MIKLLLILLGVWNVLVFALYGTDKQRATQGGRRISERTLLLAAALMGALGALLGMREFRHKTKHAKFRFGVPLLLLMNIAVLFFVAQGMGVWNKPVEYQKIPPVEAKELMQTGDVIILDVRTKPEFAESHINGAILIPDTEIIDEAPQLLPDKQQTILVYCRSGNRSKKAALALIELGYTNVYDLGGLLQWPYELN
ncbi:MAG: DUF1294 domain-containing protein [Clostridia bacterium]|nr:DUF1294 domain-containing protein [Clostridia bacterium]